MDAKRDLYRRLAREEGYPSRAAYKLIQINSKHSLLRRGNYVVDFGASPGGWLKVASDEVSNKGLVIGIDTIEIKALDENVRIMTVDVNDPSIEEKILALLGRRADVVLSDLSPKITGIWEIDHSQQVDLTLRVVELLGAILKEGGDALLKAFDGPRVKALVKKIEKVFDDVILVKPPASRGASSELYIVSKNYQPITTSR